jgi:hypothetical protein
MKDFVYKQNPDGSYAFNNGEFQLEDRNAIVDAILETLKKIYVGIVTQNNVNPGRIECNVFLLDQALTRYSRDVFGESRLNAKIEYLGNLGVLTKVQRDQLSMFFDYGLKVDSCKPYIHRQAADVLYWLSVLKPFGIFPDKEGIKSSSLGVAFEFHNEYISYILVLCMLAVFRITLDIHKNKDAFYDFLYDLHFRNLSRSSLEFFLHSNIKLIPLKDAPASRLKASAAGNGGGEGGAAG